MENGLPKNGKFPNLVGYRIPSNNLLLEEKSKYFNGLKEFSKGALLPVIWSVKDGQIIYKDLAQTKNIFIYGSQETGKTTFINQLLISLLLTKDPGQLKLIIAGIKPLELDCYRLLEKHFLTKLPENDKSIIDDHSQLGETLTGLCMELDNRFELLKLANSRNVSEYNAKYGLGKLNNNTGHQYLPFILIIIDDLPV